MPYLIDSDVLNTRSCRFRGSTGTRAYELLKLYAKSHGLHVFDSLVAASAIEKGLTLVTKNRSTLA